jgi:hypothetical protein
LIEGDLRFTQPQRQLTHRHPIIQDVTVVAYSIVGGYV